MNRSWVTWTILGVCAMLIVGAMAWSTQKVLHLEQMQTEAEAAADLKERIRLGLSRMDTGASGLLVLENQRPPHHFKAFFEPEDVFTNEFQVVGKGVVVQPSPLLSQLPDFVRLHFEIQGNDRSVHSPQVPEGNARDLAEGSGVPPEFLENASREFAILKEILGQPSVHGSAGLTNLDGLCLSCVRLEEGTAWNIRAPQSVQLQEAQVAWAENNYKGQNRVDQKYQQDLSYVDKSKRSEVIRGNQERALPQKLKSGKFGKTVPQGEAAELSADSDDAQEGSAQDKAGSSLLELHSEVSPFSPIWIGNQLFAIRQVTTSKDIRYQGIWFRADQLAEHLVGSVVDLLPGAKLEQIAEVTVSSLPGTFDLSLDDLSSDPLSLVTLPWRLQPGEAPAVAAVGWSPLRVSLLVGWIAMILALLAAAVLVRGVMKLSDRRATFVSSVTHELRTPLTTFHLYSDMLVEDMVKDETKKKGYLTTMRREAERLNHLVENVLAYSRIERGSARAKHQKISLQDLVERMQPRLHERACKDEARLEIEAVENCGQLEVDTDLTAVEQIVFNLVDNACKYGLQEEGDRVVHLRALNGGRTARIEICDEGGGIAQADLKKLFRPFHKSARDAAHSKPGVGLGLALCRRLARALGGDLKIDEKRSPGACFVLELPVTKRRVEAVSGELESA